MLGLLLQGCSVLGATVAEAETQSLVLCPGQQELPGAHGRYPLHAETGERVTLLLIQGEVIPDQCAFLDLPAEASEPIWFSLAASDIPPPSLGLQGGFEAESVVISEVIWERPQVARAASPAVTPQPMPVMSGATQTSALEIQGDPSQRAAWLWSPELWIEQPGQVWDIAAQEQLQRLYISVPVTEQQVSHPERLSDFIANSLQRGLAIWAVVGDPRDVLADNHPALEARTQAYQAFNQAHPETPLAGLQLDIEPYLLPGFSLAPDYWRQQYLTTIGLVHEQLGQAMPLDIVLPVWWGTHPDWGDLLLEGLVLPELSLTIMNYRTSAQSLLAGAEPFLEWGQTHGIKIVMALELGSLGNDEIRRTYGVTVGAGELWWLPIGEHHLLVLFDRPTAGLPGRSYLQRDEQPFNMANITFAGRRHELDALLPDLLAQWSAWSSFDGIAIHGLEESYLDPR